MGAERIQLAFQGGGAKICDLLAAAEAIQKLQSEGKIEVTRVAGTSAGAIVGCLFATGESMSRVRQYLLAHGEAFLSKIAPERGGLGSAYRIVRGKALYDVPSYRDFLWKLFTEAVDGRYEKLGDLGIPSIVIASDMLNGQKMAYHEPEKRLVDILFSSSALPFAFVGSKVGPGDLIVDGGLCENLPADELLNGKDEYGRVIGVSFERTDAPQHPEGLFDFAKSIVDTAIDSSMNRAVNILGSGSVHRIRTELTTFDFHKAIEALRGDHYERVRAEALLWFERFSGDSEDGETIILDEARGQPISRIMESIYEVYHAQHAGTPMAISRCAMIVQANSAKEEAPGHADLVKQKWTFKATTEPLMCFPIAIGSAEDLSVTGEATWSVRDRAGDSQGVIAIPAVDPHEDHGVWREILLFFNPAIQPNNLESEPYTITQQDQVVDAMRGLRDAGKDYLYLKSSRNVPIERADLVLQYPGNLPPIKMIPYAPDGLEQPEGADVGRSMTEAELAEYDDPPPGFTSVGWTITNLPPKGLFGVEFFV